MKRRVTWTVLGVVALCFAVPASLTISSGSSDTAMGQTLIWLLFAMPSLFAARLVTNRWWETSGARLSTMDCPARLLAIAVGAPAKCSERVGRRPWKRS
jgi:hypothetical protein